MHEYWFLLSLHGNFLQINSYFIVIRIKFGLIPRRVRHVF
jgi:hypothetical protein